MNIRYDSISQYIARYMIFDVKIPNRDEPNIQYLKP